MRGTPDQLKTAFQSMKLTDAQIWIVQLCGYQINPRWLVTPLPEGTKAVQQQEARASLVALLGKDFGSDLLAWHQALKASQAYGEKYWHERFDRIIESIATSK
ncbi:hypothetical protein [Thioclava sp. GXIMD4216]|uniref:hypothetical protein n=1 Tax=Thioclava sp. GXIMD4216 TaxID=3131929 RepID=UPI0030D5BFC1